MAQTILHKTLGEFQQMNDSYLDMNFYSVQPVLDNIKNHYSGSTTINTAFNITDKFGSFVFGLTFLDPNVIMLYGDCLSEDCMKSIAEMFNIDMINSHSISGSRKLILDLHKYHNKEYEILIDRLVYICSEVNNIKYKVFGHMRKADMTDVEVLSKMSYDFSVEEWGDRKEHNLLEQTHRVIIPGIVNENIYKWVEKGEIKSIAQVSIKDDAPILGHFFTPKKYRGKGYGSALLHSVTKKILNEYQDISLISNVENQWSNKAFVNTGYKVISEWIKVLPIIK